MHNMISPPLYTPASEFRTKLDDFREYVNRRYGLCLSECQHCCSGRGLRAFYVLTSFSVSDSYDELHGFSINRMNDFWESFWKFTEIKASIHPSKVVSRRSSQVSILTSKAGSG